MQAPAHSVYPGSQAKPHEPPVHVVTAFAGGAGHGVHDAPHELIDELSSHVLPQRW